MGVVVKLDYLEGYKPEDLGLSKYQAYRNHPVTGDPIQLQAIEFAAYTDKRFVGLHAPPGIGKSLIGLSVAKLVGGRAAILTATKGLQDQYVKDGVVDVRGKANYDCPGYGNCKLGSLAGCAASCMYKGAVEDAKEAEAVVTNYAYWLTGGKGLGEFDLLICDEAHSLPDILADFVGVKLWSNELAWLSKLAKATPPNDIQDEWVTYAGRVEPVLDAQLDQLRKIRSSASQAELTKLHQLEELKKKLLSVCEMESPVIERHETNQGFRWDFDIVWPGRYAEGVVFKGVPKVILMSGTLTKKTMGQLGIKMGDVAYQEFDRIFPAQRHPLYFSPADNGVGGQVRVDRRMTSEDEQLWVDHIDKIIGERLDRKGLIQTVSYDRAKLLMERSRHRNSMIGNTQDKDSPRAAATFEQFKKSGPGTVLVSPSFTTGWDLPGSSCEYIVICKVPFKPSHSKIQKAREERDKEYGPHLAMTEMVQGSCRGMRSEEDSCEVFMVDGHMSWFVGRYKHLAPGWFVKGIRKVGDLPLPLEKLKEE